MRSSDILPGLKAWAPRASAGAFACLLLVAQAAHGGDGQGLDARGIAVRGRAIQEGAVGAEPPEWLRGAVAPEWVQQAAKEVAKASAREVAPLPTGTPSGALIEIYVSTSLDEVELRRILSEAAGRPDVVVVFRGVPNEASLGKGLMVIQRLVKGMDPVPNVVIDPPRYAQRGVVAVPTMVMTENGSVKAQAVGISNIAEFSDRARQGGNLGHLGPTREIAEPDMIEEMKKRVASLDFEAMKKRAMERFWSHLPTQDLPAARTYRKRTLDPTVVTTAVIRDANGEILIPAGARVNPLDALPFVHFRLVVFDARDPGQLKKASEIVASHADERVVLIASAFDLEQGADGYRRTQEHLRAPMYALTNDIRNRFAIEKVPTVITASNGNFVIEELPVDGAH